MTSLDILFISAAILLIISVFASKVSDRFGIPALLLFLAIGMLAGYDGPGNIYFDDPNLSQAIGAAALMVILFSGGLSTHWYSVKPVLKEGITLATLGVLLTAILLGAFAHFLLGISWLEGFLLGSIVSSTDAAAVFSILRAKGVHIQPKLAALLELESGSNDPMAVFLTVGLISLLQNPGKDPLTLIPFFFQQMLIGGVIGWLAGKAALFFLNRLRLGYAGLYPVLAIGIVAMAFSGANLLKGSGFLAVYLCGVVMGQADFLHKRSLIRFFDGFAWLMQIAMFLVLGLLVFPSRIAPIALPALAITLFLMLVARPVSVLISTLPFKMGLREKAFISWVGLRGAVPIVLAIYPRIANLAQSDLIFNIIFFVVLLSVLLQGTTLPFAARLFKVEVPDASAKSFPVEFVPEQGWRGAMEEVTLSPESRANGKAIVDLNLPPSYLIVLVNRSGEYLVPSGGMVLQAGDRILGIASPECREQVTRLFSEPEARD